MQSNSTSSEEDSLENENANEVCHAVANFTNLLHEIFRHPEFLDPNENKKSFSGESQASEKFYDGSTGVESKSKDEDKPKEYQSEDSLVLTHNAIEVMRSLLNNMNSNTSSLEIQPQARPQVNLFRGQEDYESDTSNITVSDVNEGTRDKANHNFGKNQRPYNNSGSKAVSIDIAGAKLDRDRGRNLSIEDDRKCKSTKNSNAMEEEIKEERSETSAEESQPLCENDLIFLLSCMVDDYTMKLKWNQGRMTNPPGCRSDLAAMFADRGGGEGMGMWWHQQYMNFLETGYEDIVSDEKYREFKDEFLQGRQGLLEIVQHFEFN